MSLIEKIVDEITDKKYSLKEIEKRFDIPVRKVGYLIRKDVIKPIVEEGKLLVSEAEVKRYLSLPKNERKNHHKSFLKSLGPGVITGASDDDPSGLITYSVAGSQFALSLSWMALYLLPLMTAVQETCGRIGVVTGEGLAAGIKRKFGNKILFCLVLFLVIANVINIGADLGSMVAAIQLLIPVNFYLGAVLVTTLMLFLMLKFPYHTYARFLKWLTISLLAYIVTGIAISPDWLEVGRNIIVPHFRFDPAFIAAMVAIMGTSISPYLFFWQTSEEVEEEKEKADLEEHDILALKEEIKDMRKDTFAGMSISNLVFLFIVVTTYSVLFKNGIHEINSAQAAAQALRPFAGDLSYLLFTVGIIGTGLLAVPVLAGSTSYAVSELFNWNEGLSEKYSKAKGFYGVIIVSVFVGLLINFIGINPMKALFYAAIVNGLASPILLFFIFRLGDDKKIMGKFTSPTWVRVFGYFAFLLMSLAAVALIALSVKGY